MDKPDIKDFNDNEEYEINAYWYSLYLAASTLSNKVPDCKAMIYIRKDCLTCFQIVRNGIKLDDSVDYHICEYDETINYIGKRLDASTGEYVDDLNENLRMIQIAASDKT